MAGRPFHFVRSDSLDRLLHLVDGDVGARLEETDPQLASREVRDRYILRSLAEEAITSSQLEGASTTRQVAKEMLLSGRAPRTKDERMIANNFMAMEYLRRHAGERLTLGMLLELHRTLTEDTLDDPDEVGRLRRADEAVVVQDRAGGGVVHVPPPAGELEARLEALTDFANSKSDEPFVHPLIRAITLHFALSYEHPFVDGNGRTARALFYWSMLRVGYWMAEFLSISRIIQRAPAQYSRAFLLTETDGADLTYFLLHQLEVIRSAIADLHVYLARKVKEVRDLDHVLKVGSEWNPRQRALLARALRHPGAVYTVALHQREHGVVYETARSDLRRLEEAGLLKRKQSGKKFVFVAAPRLGRLKRGR
jgi:Fic family protein